MADKTDKAGKILETPDTLRARMVREAISNLDAAALESAMKISEAHLREGLALMDVVVSGEVK